MREHNIKRLRSKGYRVGKWQEKYSRPKDDTYRQGHFTVIKGKKCSEKKREWHFYDSTGQIFINIEILGGQAFMCAVIDGVDMYHHKGSDVVFVDSQWAIDEKIGGDECQKELMRLTGELRSVIETLPVVDVKKK